MSILQIRKRQGLSKQIDYIDHQKEAYKQNMTNLLKTRRYSGEQEMLKVRRITEDGRRVFGKKIPLPFLNLRLTPAMIAWMAL